MGSWHYEHGWQRKRTKYTVPSGRQKEHSFTAITCMLKGEYACDTCSIHFYIIAVKGCSFVYLRNCIFCPLSLSVIFIVWVELRLCVSWKAHIFLNILILNTHFGKIWSYVFVSLNLRYVILNNKMHICDPMELCFGHITPKVACSAAERRVFNKFYPDGRPGTARF